MLFLSFFFVSFFVSFNISPVSFFVYIIQLFVEFFSFFVVVVGGGVGAVHSF